MKAEGKFYRVVLMAVLVALTVMLPVFAFGVGRPISETNFASTLCPTDDGGLDLNADLPFQATQAPEDSEDAPSFGIGPEMEEEIKALHLPADLSRLGHRAWLPDERVDHAYEAWFYSVTHPPLTPPPNAR